MSAYCQPDEVRAMIKDDALDIIIGNVTIEDDNEREMKIMPLISDAIGDASAEIDGHLARKYSLPLPFIPKVVNKFAKDMAVYNLFSRIGIDESGPDKNYLTRYNAAIAFFKMAADGKVDIGISDNTDEARTGFTVTSNRRIFTRDGMRGM